MSDVLPVVTVTYSPGPHLDRFLASLSHATERPVSVLMADNGSTDGTPQAAVPVLVELGARHGAEFSVAARRLDDTTWVVHADPL